LAELTSLPARRINAAVRYLDEEELAKAYPASGEDPFTFMQINATSATRLFVAKNA
jgi:hypothetical protein